MKKFPMGFLKSDTYESMEISDPFISKDEHFPKFNGAASQTRLYYSCKRKSWMGEFVPGSPRHESKS